MATANEDSIGYFNVNVMSKRIVYIVGDLSYPNGMSRVLSQKVNYLAEHTDYELYVVLTEQADKPWYYQLSPKIQHVNFGLDFDSMYQMPFLKRLLAYNRKQKQYRKLLTDYLMQVRPDITVSVLRREINFINDIPDGSKKVGEIHFNKQTYRVFEKHWLPGWVNRFITHRWQKSLEKEVRRLDKFVVLTRQDARNWVGFDNVIVIPNPISFFPQTVSDGQAKKVIAVGRYTKQKGFDLLIQAWQIVNAHHPDWVLNIYGPGNREEYQQMVDALKLSEVIHCNEASPDIYARYAEHSIFVLSSRYEGFGLVIAEAMATGLPAVSFRCPCGPEDIVTDHEDGLLVENGNVEELAEAICYMIDHPEERYRMAKKALLSAQRYHEDVIMQKWIQLFDSL